MTISGRINFSLTWEETAPVVPHFGSERLSSFVNKQLLLFAFEISEKLVNV